MKNLMRYVFPLGAVLLSTSGCVLEDGALDVEAAEYALDSVGLSPQVECIRDIDPSDGVFEAQFGYFNKEDLVLEVPVGSGSPSNFFDGGSQDRGQPTSFLPGRHRYVFSVTIPDTQSLVWNLNGRTAAASLEHPHDCPELIINEVLANEPGRSTQYEFIELVNLSGSPINLERWTLHDAYYFRHEFAAGTWLFPDPPESDTKKSLVVYGGDSAIPADALNAVAASTGRLGLNNDGDTVTLKNSVGDVVLSHTYTSELSSTDGVSMNRSPDADPAGQWVLHTTLSSQSSSPGTRADGTSF